MPNTKFKLPEDLKEITDFGFQVFPENVVVYPPDVLVLTLNHYPLEAVAKLFSSLQTTQIRYYDITFDGAYQTKLNPDGTITCSPYCTEINGKEIGRTPVKLKILKEFKSIQWKETNGNT
jgi:hypothetical protein